MDTLFTPLSFRPPRHLRTLRGVIYRYIGQFELKFAVLLLIQSYLNHSDNGEKHPQKLWNRVQPLPPSRQEKCPQLSDFFLLMASQRLMQQPGKALGGNFLAESNSAGHSKINIQKVKNVACMKCFQMKQMMIKRRIWLYLLPGHFDPADYSLTNSEIT